MIVTLIIVLLFSVTAAISESVVITVITSSEDVGSTNLLDSVLLPFVYQKSVANYAVDVIPSGNMYWDKTNRVIACKGGEKQCFKNLLQYCAIREYSYEIAHEFVRCVQTRNGDGQGLYNLCKRFGSLYYGVIDNCLNKRDIIMKELYDLGQRYMKKGDPSIPQLRYGNQYISLEKLVSDQQFIFDRLKNRICNLENNKELLKKPCESPYNLFVESIMLQQEEQFSRGSRSDARLIKYTNEVYTTRTLRAFASALQQNEAELNVIFDVNKTVIKEIIPDLMELGNDLMRVNLLPVGINDITCSDATCILYKALICGYESDDTPFYSQYSLCLLQAPAINDTVIRECAISNYLFPPSIMFCMTSNSISFVGNITSDIQSIVNDYFEEKTVMDLAAMEDEDLLLEAEADTDDLLLPEVVDQRKHDLTSLMPISLFLNSKRIYCKEGSLKDCICKNMKIRPFFCDNGRMITAITKPQGPLPELRVDLYLNIQCSSNILALDPLMQWLMKHPSLTKKVPIIVNPMVDVLIDKNERKELEFRTPSDHNHIAKAFVTSCVVRMTRDPRLYWKFVTCMHEKKGLATVVANQCISEVGVDVKSIQNCLTNDDFLEELVLEKEKEMHKHFWASVSPYVYIGGDHVIRLETVAKKICDFVSNDDPACESIPFFEQSAPHCMIKAIY